MTPDAVADALSVCADQLTAMLPKSADRDGRLRWQRVRDHGRSAACRHDQCRPVPALDLASPAATRSVRLRETVADRPRQPQQARAAPGRSATGYLIALISSPLAVSPLSSQKNVPPSPCWFLYVILEPMVSGVS